MRSKNQIFAIASLVFFGIFLAFCGWQSKNFKIDASADTLLMKDNRHYIESLVAAERYNPVEFILIAFKPSKKHIFEPESLRILEQIESKTRKIERVKNVRSIINVPIFLGIDSLSTSINPDDLTWKSKKYDAAYLKKNLKSHPLYENLLFNEQQTALSIQVVFEQNQQLVKIDREILDIKRKILDDKELSSAEEDQLQKLKDKRTAITDQLNKQRSKEIKQIRDIVKSYEAEGEFFLGGNNLLAEQLINIIRNDLVIFGGAVILVVALVLFLIYRRFRWVILPIACCAASVLITVGLLGAFELRVTVISANVIALQIILTLAVMIHLIEHYRELAREHSDLGQSQLVLQTVKEKFKPCFYAGLTTSIGFGSLIFSGVQPVISFGWMMVLAMGVTLMVSLALFPSLLILLSRTSGSSGPGEKASKYFKSLAKSVSNYPKTHIIAGTLCTALGVVGCFWLTSENSFLNYFHKSTDVYKELSFIDKELGGSTALDVLYKIPKDKQQEDLVLTAEALQKLAQIEQVLVSEESVGSVTSLSDFTKIAAVVNNKPITEYELTTLYKMLDDDLKNDLFGSYFSEQAQELRLAVRISDSTPDLDRAQLVKDFNAQIKSLGLEEKDFKLTGLFILYQDILERLVDSQLYTLLIVYGAMSIVLLVIFRSISIALIALVPNAVTTAIIMGAMGAFGIPLDLMTITIAAVAMGISMDDTIHYVHRYIEESKKSKGSDVVKNTNLSVGLALLYTSIVITLGFSALIFSDFVPSILFGALTGVAMITAFIADITILPALLFLFNTKKKS